MRSVNINSLRPLYGTDMQKMSGKALSFKLVQYLSKKSLDTNKSHTVMLLEYIFRLLRRHRWHFTGKNVSTNAS